MWVHLKSNEPFALAGLWDTWRKPDGKRVESFTIITTEPNELVRPIHNRMPVILQREDEEQLLDASRISFAGTGELTAKGAKNTKERNRNSIGSSATVENLARQKPQPKQECVVRTTVGHPFKDSVTVEAPSGRADGFSRRFSNRQLGEVRRPRVHPTCFGSRRSFRRAVVFTVTRTSTTIASLQRTG